MASDSVIGFPPLITGPFPMDFPEIAAVGFTSRTAGAPGVRAIRYRKRVCAPAIPALAARREKGVLLSA